MFKKIQIVLIQPEHFFPLLLYIYIVYNFLFSSCPEFFDVKNRKKMIKKRLKYYKQGGEGREGEKQHADDD